MNAKNRMMHIRTTSTETLMVFPASAKVLFSRLKVFIF